jgi:hypothetical protein
MFQSTTILIVLFSIFGSSFPVYITEPSTGDAQEKPNISFEWAFATLSGSEKNQTLVPIAKDTTLKSGDELKMMVKPNSKCFVYVIHESSTGEIVLRFPYDLKQFDSDYKIGKQYYIPRATDWFKLDGDAGRETFYVLGSAQRLTDLETLLGTYNNADASKKPALAKEIVSQIRNVRKRYKTFSTFAERPISIGGNIRGVVSERNAKRPDVASVATEIAASNFYGKTITINHK